MGTWVRSRRSVQPPALSIPVGRRTSPCRGQAWARELLTTTFSFSPQPFGTLCVLGEATRNAFPGHVLLGSLPLSPAGQERMPWPVRGQRCRERLLAVNASVLGGATKVHRVDEEAQKEGGLPKATCPGQPWALDQGPCFLLTLSVRFAGLVRSGRTGYGFLLAVPGARCR